MTVNGTVIIIIVITTNAYLILTTHQTGDRHIVHTISFNFHINIWDENDEKTKAGKNQISCPESHS